MKYRKLGNTGLIVSGVALGTMQFGGKMNMGNLDQEGATRMVKLALERGINFIDTADVYSLGESETLVGNALKGMRKEIVLATKVRLPMGENFNRSGATRVNILREVEFQSYAEYHNIGILAWSPLAGVFLTGKYSRANPAPAGTRFAEAGNFVPFDKEMGYRVVEALKEVSGRHDATLARVALAWVLGRPAVSSVIIAARKPEQLADNIRAVDLGLLADELRLLDAASDPGVPYPKWMVLQLDTAEDPRSKVLYP